MPSRSRPVVTPTRFPYRFSASVSRSGSAGGLRPRGRAGDGPDGDQARARLRGEGVTLPADLEVASALSRQLAAGALDTQRAGLALADLVALPARRAPHRPLLPRCWELPDDLTIYDATYVALAAETATDSVRTGLLTCTLVWPRRANPGSVRARGDEA